MEITRIKVDSLSPKEPNTCAEFSITFDDMLVIHNIRVIEGKKGLFIAFPSSGEAKIKDNQKRYFDVVHPTNQKFRQIIEDEVLKKYYDEVAKK